MKIFKINGIILKKKEYGENNLLVTIFSKEIGKIVAMSFGITKSKKRNLHNILFVRKRGETILDFLGKNEISGVYINFPDPWEGEEKKRVISEDLFKKLDVVLKSKGKLFFKTDHEQYYRDVLELVENLENYEVIFHTDDLHNSEKAQQNIKTEFEQMFLSKHNMNIKYIEIQRN